MKKLFLFLASLMLGVSQLMADNVTFSVSDLKATLPSNNTNIAIPYTWKTSPYHVSVNIAKKDGTTATLGVSTVIAMNGTYQFTVSVAGKGTLNSIKLTTDPSSQSSNVSANAGTYSSGTWTPGETSISSVTFTCTGTFRLTQIAVDYTKDDSYTPDVPDTPTTGDPIEAVAIDDIASYTGSEPFVYNKTNMKYYALNNLGTYEEYGIYTKVNTLKVAGGSAATQIEWIKSKNNAYINLNYIPKANSKAIAVINAETGGDWKAIYGCGYDQNGWKDRFCFFTTNATINLGGETTNRDAMRYGDKIVTVLDAVAGKMDIFEADGETLIGTITDSPKNADCKTPLYVFAQNKDVPGGGKKTDCYNTLTTLYSLKIYEGETLVLDLVPAINSEGLGGLKDQLTGTFYGSANSGTFQLSPDGEAMASDAGISVYEGKRVKLTTDNHEYKYQNGTWLDCGAMTIEEIANASYKDMRNWETNNDHASIFSGFTYDGTTNEINPYHGTGGYEPYMFKIETTEGEDYNWSFIYSGSAYDSWHGVEIHPFVSNAYDLGTTETGANYNGNVIGIAEAFPFSGAENKAYSIDFTAKQKNETLVIQFGDGNDGKDFWFKFANLKVGKYVYPNKYEDIDFVAQDNNKYTPLAYIESTSASRENAYTTNYIANINTEVDIKFNLYSNNNWAAIFSGRDGQDAGKGISLYKNGGADKFGYFVGGHINDNQADFPGFNQDITVSATLGNLNVNGVDNTTGRTSFNASSRAISMFANPEWDNPIRGRIYYMTIKENGKTIYDFQPVMRHDGAFGYYDRKSASFVIPAKGNWDGYSYKMLEDQTYITYNKETRIVIVGSTAQFLPEIQNLPSAMFSWKSADESIATVTADGTVTGKKAGKVIITVATDADQGWTASYELTVAEPEYKRFDADKVGYAIVTGGGGSVWGDSPVANLLDNNAETKFGCSNAGDAWAIIVASEPVAVKQYSIVTGADTYTYPSRNPASWKLEGSNDNQNWALIDERVQTYQLQAKNKEENKFQVNGTEKYKFFKFSATQLADGFQVGEFWINAQAYAWGEPTETAATCSKLGEKVTECTNSHVLKTEVLPLAAHAYENGICKVCGAKASEVVLLPSRGDKNTPYYAKFRHKNEVSDKEYVDIEEGWTDVNFDDSAWDELMMPLGSFGTYHTRWFAERNTFWFRRDFKVKNPASITKLTLRVTHDDDCAVFLNGKKIWNELNWTNGENDWRTIEVDPALLVEGKNVLAMYIEQNTGGAYCDFGLDAKVGATIEVSDAKYATFVAPCDIDFTGADVTANAARFDGTYVQLAPVTTIPAGIAVVVKAEEGKYTVPATTDAAFEAVNELVAATADVKADGTQYILAKNNGSVGFYKAAAESTIAAGKGYLVLGASAVKAFYPFFGEDATGIANVNDNVNDNQTSIYNLAGQRINKLQKGINIVNGKKILK